MPENYLTGIKNQLVKILNCNALTDNKFGPLLFYLGFTTNKETDIFGNNTYTIPNKLIKIMIWEFIHKSINEVYNLRMNIDFFATAFLKMATKGEWRPVFKYITELKYIKSAFLKTKAKAEPEIKRAIETATAQLDQYSPYDNCTTTKIIIVASARKLLYMDLIGNR